MDDMPLTKIKDQLFCAFRDDHAVLGRGLYDLATLIRAKDVPKVRVAAAKLANDAGAHIAFEEANFYPALEPFLSQSEIDEMYADHAQGRALIHELANLKLHALDDKTYCERLLSQIESAEHHVSECGELFGAMGGLSKKTQAQLLEQLKSWRKRAPSWFELSNGQ